MNIFFDKEQLLQLIANLYTLTGIRANIFGINGRDICLTGDHAPFCERINACPKAAPAVHPVTLRRYICAAPLPASTTTAATPVSARPSFPFSAATPHRLVFSQFLDESPLELQWEQSCQSLDWYPGGLLVHQSGGLCLPGQGKVDLRLHIRRPPLGISGQRLPEQPVAVGCVVEHRKGLEMVSAGEAVSILLEPAEGQSALAEIPGRLGRLLSGGVLHEVLEPLILARIVPDALLPIVGRNQGQHAPGIVTRGPKKIGNGDAVLHQAGGYRGRPGS